MYTIAVDGLNELQQRFATLGRDLTKAVAKGINATAAKIINAEQAGFKQHLDRPSPFTVNSLGLLKANTTHREPAALIFVKPIAAEYLQRSIFGGEYEGLHPSKIRLNQYGNIPKRKGTPEGMVNLISNDRQFVGAIKTRRGEELFGLFERPRRRKGKAGSRSRQRSVSPPQPIKVLVYNDQGQRRPVLPYVRIAETTATQHLNADVLAEINLLLAQRDAPGTL